MGFYLEILLARVYFIWLDYQNQTDEQNIYIADGWYTSICLKSNGSILQ